MITKQEKLLLAIKTLYFLGIAIANTFAQVYLYNYTGSFFQMSIYTICRCIMIALFYYIAAKMCTRFKIVIPLVSGLALIATSLIYMLYLKDRIGESYLYVYFIGLIWGAGEGLFWFSCATLQQFITKIETRSKFFAYSGALSGIAGILAPLLSATILFAMPSIIQGYYIIFQITIVLFVLASLLSTRLVTNNTTQPIYLKDKLTWKSDHRWRWMLKNSYFYGIRDAASFSITGLLIYDAAASNSALYGNIVSGLAIASVIAYVLAGRIIHPRNLTKIMLISSVIVSISGAILVLLPNVYGALLHGILFNLSYAFYDNSYAIFQMNEFSYYIDQKENINERIVIKEGYLNLGRITGFLMIMALLYFLPQQLAMTSAMIVLYSFATVVALYTKKHEAKLHSQLVSEKKDL